MDSLITAAARALAAGDLLGALKRVALRDDAPALALRGIVMAQLGDLVRAKTLLRSAARAFGPKEALARARCVVAEAEIALVSRDLGWPAKALDTARVTLEAHGDRVNAAHARNLESRYRSVRSDPDPVHLPAGRGTGAAPDAGTPVSPVTVTAPPARPVGPGSDPPARPRPAGPLKPRWPRQPGVRPPVRERLPEDIRVNDRARLRILVLRVLVLSLFVTLGTRLWYLQVMEGSRYRKVAETNRVREVVTPATRGLIVDDRGRALVRNRTSLTISVDRSVIDRQHDHGVAVLRRLSQVIKMPYPELHRRIQFCTATVGQPCWNGSPYQPIPVARDVTAGQALAVIEHPELFPGVSADLQAVRQ